ncbi:APC family permease [Sciscionella sediminilitoris]|uniref:APC family permease n=1 Tax=Sciscionella sediminilitoris TaxID=1445613 RepID=UPI0004DF01F2|nr:APC family permease [Sciscionella sp. SE31]
MSGPPSTTGEFVNTESQNIRRNLRRFDTICFAIAAIISIDTIGQIATSGAEAFTWTAVLVVTLLFPYGLIMAELGSAFPHEGGPYVWLRKAFGKLTAGVGTMFYWITNPVWLGGSITFLAAATWESFLVPGKAGGVGDYLFKIVFIWIAILGAVVSLRYGKWFVTFGAICKVGLVAVFAVTVLIYAARNGVHGYAAGAFAPTASGFLGVAPVLMFALVGFEAPNGAAEEMHNPRRDVPRMVAVSGITSALCYLVPIFGIVAVLPSDKINGLDGFMGAIGEVFSVYGSAAPALTAIAAAVFVLVLLNQGVSWMMASDRVQAVAGMDGAFPRWFGAFHPKLNTPLRVNLLSGVVATAFMLVATQLQSGSGSAVFGVVLNVAVSTLLMSYLVIFPTVLVLRRKASGAERPFKVPFGRLGLGVCFGISYLWVLLGVWQTVAPGVLESAFGVPYDFRGTWGISRAEFELFTFGTLAVIALLALGGYAIARRNRAPSAEPAARQYS